MTTETHILDLAAAIVAAYVSNNAVAAGDLPKLIESVHAQLIVTTLGAPEEQPKLTPPVPIKKTVTPDAIISLEDGKPYKSLRRHLTSRGLTFEEYKAKWGLPENYPAVAPNYAAQRSELAKSIGLGQKRKLRAVA